MTLSFPNQSRSFDKDRNAVRFTGYDGMFEVPFYIEVDALARVLSQPLSVQDCLTAFDAERTSILDVAREVYAHRKLTSYTLTAANFH
ncbi:DUF1488 domain-containing protein [Nitratireductor basaltis]|uniref:DUF1488 domain-containing protein n=1 Tax=Nitratireductor basaltis TaxID=472175 RepID=A0A084U646_9HYPH|nr:DUF1488 domain-containing protein [Nitratireductor basaltis]KFB08432.1 hypothetical protein EL18_02683 [Nitratireductor basaltis]